MHEKDLEALEYPKVLAQVARRATFEPGRQAVLALRPTADLPLAQQWQAQTREARRVLTQDGPATDLSDALDIRPWVDWATREKILSPEELLGIWRTIQAARRIRRVILRRRRELPHLSRIAHRIVGTPDLVEAIEQALTRDGRVRDQASPELARVRAALRRTHQALLQHLERLIRDPDVRPWLQEPIITRRHGRYVLPVKAEHRHQLPGIVLDQSGSGATVFMEPMSVVEENNRLRTLEKEEEREVRRVLARLTRRVAIYAARLRQMVEVLAELDAIFARARYADELDAEEPELVPFRPREGHPGSTLRLYRARHPLLPQDKAVPIDVVLDDETYVLVLTGPNTGGKTVTLKTVGLLALMAQSGLPIPAAAGSALSVFDGIYADIGDEQSIEQSLSTFSAHLTNLIRILKHATSRSLALLDELGAGTDPQEGAALAQALLDAFVRKRVTTLVATHYPALKLYAHRTPGVRNASMEFDPETLRPTYRLRIGLPGRSNALIIAERLGLDPEILAAARAGLHPDDVAADDLLADLQRQHQAAERARAEWERKAREAQALAKTLQARLDAWERERTRLLAQTRAQLEEEIERLQRQVRRLERRLRQGSGLADAADAQALVDEVREQADARLADIEVQSAAQTEMPSEDALASVLEPGAESADAVRAPEDEVDEAPAGFAPGAPVALPALGGQVGHIVRLLDEDEAEVQVGPLTLRVRLYELEPLSRRAARKRQGRVQVEVRELPRVPPPEPELHLRGLTVDEALERLERYLERAYLAGMPFVRIVHGKGSGTLREAVHRFLRTYPHVRRFTLGRPGEGDRGVTVVYLEN
ncbi:MAG: endonuclease MutS2 [Chloroflexi bacterium]|nr:endonuclease MutS2 [Chloroflexota bacterium]